MPSSLQAHQGPAISTDSTCLGATQFYLFIWWLFIQDHHWSTQAQFQEGPYPLADHRWGVDWEEFDLGFGVTAPALVPGGPWNVSNVQCRWDLICHCFSWSTAPSCVWCTHAPYKYINKVFHLASLIPVNFSIRLKRWRQEFTINCNFNSMYWALYYTVAHWGHFKIIRWIILGSWHFKLYFTFQIQGLKYQDIEFIYLVLLT